MNYNNAGGCRVCSLFVGAGLEVSQELKWLTPQQYSQAVDALPLVSVDLVVVNPLGQVLLGLRRNAPAQNWWFTPGASVRKSEPFSHALERVAKWELGLQAEDIRGARLMGVWDHFYEDSAFSAEVSTHYVNLPHVLKLSGSLDLNALPSEQHSDWRWEDAHEAAVAEDVHHYVRVYAQWVLDH